MDLPQPAWKPDIVENVSSIVECMRTYTDEKRAFVAFKYGTIVFSNLSAPRPDSDYKATLMAVAHQSPDFKVIPMEDKNLLVRFTGPVSGLVLVDHYLANSSNIQRGVIDGGLLPGEQLITPSELAAPEDHYYAGLYARAKLYQDINSCQIVERFIP